VRRRGWRSAVAHLSALAAAIVAAALGLNISAVPNAVWILCGSLLALFLASLVTLPEVLASVSHRDQMRRLASTVLGPGYWAVIVLLASSLLLVIFAAVGSTPDASTVSQPAASRLLSTAAWEWVRAGGFGLFLFDAVIYIAFFGKLVRRVSSSERVVGLFCERVRWHAIRGKRQRLVAELTTAIDIGREAAAGFEKKLVQDALMDIGATLLQREPNSARVESLGLVITGLTDIVCDSSSPGSAENAVVATHAIKDLLTEASRNWGHCEMDYGAFTDAIGKVALLAVRNGQENAAGCGVSVLVSLAETQIRLSDECFIPPRTVAFNLERLGIAYLDADQPAGALTAVSGLMQIARTRPHGKSEAVDPGALGHALWLASRVLEDGECSPEVLAKVLGGLCDVEGVVERAISYIEEVDPLRDGSLVTDTVGRLKAAATRPHGQPKPVERAVSAAAPGS